MAKERKPGRTPGDSSRDARDDAAILDLLTSIDSNILEALQTRVEPRRPEPPGAVSGDSPQPSGPPAPSYWEEVGRQFQSPAQTQALLRTPLWPQKPPEPEAERPDEPGTAPRPTAAEAATPLTEAARQILEAAHALNRALGDAIAGRPLPAGQGMHEAAGPQFSAADLRGLLDRPQRDEPGASAAPVSAPRTPEPPQSLHRASIEPPRPTSPTTLARVIAPVIPTAPAVPPVSPAVAAKFPEAQPVRPAPAQPLGTPPLARPTLTESRQRVQERSGDVAQQILAGTGAPGAPSTPGKAPGAAQVASEAGRQPSGPPPDLGRLLEALRATPERQAVPPLARQLGAEPRETPGVGAPGGNELLDVLRELTQELRRTREGRGGASASEPRTGSMPALGEPARKPAESSTSATTAAALHAVRRKMSSPIIDFLSM